MTDKQSPETVIGLHDGISNDVYQNGPGISRSSLFKIYSKSPAHYKFPPPEDDLTPAKRATLDFGTASHIAILEPETFDARVFRGPDDRRGNKWTDAVAYCEATGKIPLVAEAYDEVLAIRDVIHANSRVNSIITGGKPRVEMTGYWHDQETDQLCKLRTDLYRPDIGIVLDVKSTASAHPTDFAKSVVNFGYHVQEAFYSDGLMTLGEDLQGFLFLVYEKESPYAMKLYELPPSIVDEGRAIYRKALDTYVACKAANHWPAFGDEISELSFPRWSYKLTKAPIAATEEYA